VGPTYLIPRRRRKSLGSI